MPRPRGAWTDWLPAVSPLPRCRYKARSRQSLHARGVDVAADLLGVLDIKVLLSIAEEDVLGIPVSVRVKVKVRAGVGVGVGVGVKVRVRVRVRARVRARARARAGLGLGLGLGLWVGVPSGTAYRVG